MENAAGVMPNLDTKPEGAIAADPASPQEVQPVISRHSLDMRKPLPRGYGHPDGEGDESLHVEFYRHPVDDQDHVRIAVPGDKLSAFDYLAEDGRPPYKERFERQWHAYQNAQSQYLGQTMLTDVPWIDEAMRTHLAEFKVITLEQLAAVSDTSLQRLGPGSRRLREKAVGIVANQSANQEGAAMRARIAELEDTVKKLAVRDAGMALTAADLPAGDGDTAKAA